MERYAKRRAELELEQERLLTQITGEEDSEDDIYGKLVDMERELSRYAPIEMNVVDETYNMEEMDKAIVALEEYKKLLD